MALLFSAGCGDGESANEQRFKVGTWKTAQTIQPFFYEQVAEDDSKLKVLPFTNPADQKTALLAGSLDMCGTTLAHAIQSASRGEPVVLVAALCNKCSALVVRRDSAIESVAGLKGATIGSVPGTMHEILLRNLLRTKGLSVDQDVTLMRVDFFDMGTALANGNIDAFLSGEPFPSMAAAKGYGRILAYPYIEEGIGTINAGMLVRRETIEKHPERVQALVNMHAAATRFLHKHPEQWLDAAARFGVERGVLEQARVLILHPGVLLMDEPFAALDYQTRGEMQDLLLDLWRRLEQTVVFVTHDIEEAIKLADTVLILGAGPATIEETLDVSMPRPRDETSPPFMQLRRQVRDKIETIQTRRPALSETHVKAL